MNYLSKGMNDKLLEKKQGDIFTKLKQFSHIVFENSIKWVSARNSKGRVFKQTWPYAVRVMVPAGYEK